VATTNSVDIFSQIIRNAVYEDGTSKLQA
jgi:hypothetical protein